MMTNPQWQIYLCSSYTLTVNHNYSYIRHFFRSSIYNFKFLWHVTEILFLWKDLFQDHFFRKNCSSLEQNFWKNWTGAENFVVSEVLHFSWYHNIRNVFSLIVAIYMSCWSRYIHLHCACKCEIMQQCHRANYFIS